MVDVSFTVAPRQRNIREENKMIKEGKGDELWHDKPNKKRHKDTDARWTKKNNETFFIGNSRSGTTMLANILGKLPNVYVFKELHFFDIKSTSELVF